VSKGGRGLDCGRGLDSGLRGQDKAMPHEGRRDEFPAAFSGHSFPL